jgi:rhodanese-related sulfurtransferase
MDGEITPEELSALRSESDAPHIVDIRNPAQFRRGHIPGSENVPFGELPDAVEEFSGADRIVTVCPHGKASVQAAQLFASYEGTADAVVESLEGGLEAWDGPLESDEAAAERRPRDSTDDPESTDDPDAPF